MAGKALTMHEQARVVVAAGDRSVNRSALARELGISRQWLGELIRRVEVDPPTAFAPRSRAPRRPVQTDPAVEDVVVRLRKELMDAGVSAGADAIRWHLEDRGLPVVSTATIWRLCRRRGLVEPMPKRRPKSSYQRFEYDEPNGCWQIDYTHWQLRNGAPVVIMNIIDDHSRVCVATVAAARSSSGLAWQTFSVAAERWGVPARLLSDNGLEFTGRSRSGSVFRSNVQLLGVRTITSTPYHPTTCGKVERLHQTIKKFLRAHRPAQSIPALQTLLDEWQDRYNNGPHRSLGRTTPTRRWHATPPASPGAPTLEHDRRVVNLLAHPKGRLELRPWQIALGTRWANHDVIAFVDGYDVTIFTRNGALIRHLQINPDRRYQPLSNT